jgi:hypothetical protein
MNRARRIVERVKLISSLLARELRKASVREPFAKAFRGTRGFQFRPNRLGAKNGEGAQARLIGQRYHGPGTPP